MWSIILYVFIIFVVDGSSDASSKCSEIDSNEYVDNYIALWEKYTKNQKDDNLRLNKRNKRQEWNIFGGLADLIPNIFGGQNLPFEPVTYQPFNKQSCLTIDEIAKYWLAYMEGNGHVQQVFEPVQLTVDSRAISDHSFCHWTYVNNTNHMRWPSVIPEVLCNRLSSRECYNPQGGNYSIGKTECEPVHWKVRVLRLVPNPHDPGCSMNPQGGYYDVTPDVEHIKVACACVTKRIVRPPGDGVIYQPPSNDWDSDIPAKPE